MSVKKYLDDTGLGTVWSYIKNYLTTNFYNKTQIDGKIDKVYTAEPEYDYDWGGYVFKIVDDDFPYTSFDDMPEGFEFRVKFAAFPDDYDEPYIYLKVGVSSVTSMYSSGLLDIYNYGYDEIQDGILPNVPYELVIMKYTDPNDQVEYTFPIVKERHPLIARADFGYIPRQITLETGVSKYLTATPTCTTAGQMAQLSGSIKFNTSQSSEKQIGTLASDERPLANLYFKICGDNGATAQMRVTTTGEIYIGSFSGGSSGTSWWNITACYMTAAS